MSNNLADAVRQMTANKRDVGREVSLQQAGEQSSIRLVAWLACEIPPNCSIEQEERMLELVGALAKPPTRNGCR